MFKSKPEEEKEPHLKIVAMGDACKVDGQNIKTQLFAAFIKNHATEKDIPWVIENYEIPYNSQGNAYYLHLHDTAQQENLSSLRKRPCLCS